MHKFARLVRSYGTKLESDVIHLPNACRLRQDRWTSMWVKRFCTRWCVKWRRMSRQVVTAQAATTLELYWYTYVDFLPVPPGYIQFEKFEKVLKSAWESIGRDDNEKIYQAFKVTRTMHTNTAHWQWELRCWIKTKKDFWCQRTSKTFSPPMERYLALRRWRRCWQLVWIQSMEGSTTKTTQTLSPHNSFNQHQSS